MRDENTFNLSEKKDVVTSSSYVFPPQPGSILFKHFFKSKKKQPKNSETRTDGKIKHDSARRQNKLNQKYKLKNVFNYENDVLAFLLVGLSH